MTAYNIISMEQNIRSDFRIERENRGALLARYQLFYDQLVLNIIIASLKLILFNAKASVA